MSTLLRLPPIINVSIFLTISFIHLTLASYAPHAICGVNITLLRSKIRLYGLSFVIGSTEYTSTPSPPILPFSTAVTSAFSSATAPRETLINITPSLVPMDGNLEISSTSILFLDRQMICGKKLQK